MLSSKNHSRSQTVHVARTLSGEGVSEEDKHVRCTRLLLGLFLVISLCCSNLWCAGSGFLFTFRSCFRGCVAFYFGGHDERSCFEIITCWPCPSGSFSVPFFKYPHETSLTELIVIASTCFFGPKSFPQQHH